MGGIQAVDPKNMKDIIEEIDSRIKSPFFGYFLISFVAINWERLFYLIVDNGPVSARIEYFNNGSDLSSLIVCPFILASLYSIVYPWLQLAFMKLARFPTRLKNSLQAESESDLLTQRQALEKSRAKLFESREKELIERARRDAEADEIKDQGVREKLQSEIKSLREKSDAANDELGSDEEAVLIDIAQKQGLVDLETYITCSEFDAVRIEYYLESLESAGYLQRKFNRRNGVTEIKLTTKGKKFAVDVGAVS